MKNDIGPLDHYLIQLEHNYIRIVANKLAKAQTQAEMAEILMEISCEALKSNSACLFILRPDGQYEMIAQKGCTLRFQEECKLIPKEILPLANVTKSQESIFFGTASEFKCEIPEVSNLVDHSERGAIAYVPLVANGVAIGIFGFAYNNNSADFTQKEFVLTLANLFSLAFERARLFEQECLARKEAEHANRAKTEFLANISHEIRTPVGVIQGFAELMSKSAGLTEQQRRWVTTIRRNAVHLGALIGDVLDISRIEAEKVVVKQQTFLLSNLIENVLSITSSKAQELGVVLNIISPHEYVELIADKDHIRQILVNLVDNAIKFSNHRPVRAEIIYEHGKFKALVTDQGIGIAEENHLKIFEPFTQVDTASSRVFGGAGLGLSISKRLAQAMGGELKLVKSNPLQGSIFLLEVPCQASFDLRAPDLNSDQSVELRLSGLKVLMVDDSADNRDLISYLLCEEGADVEVATNGEDGVSMALQKKYDVVLMDIQMPKLDGFEAVSLLREKGYRGAIAALTAQALLSDKEKSAQRGFNDYLTKPVDPVQLVKTVQRLATV